MLDDIVKVLQVLFYTVSIAWITKQWCKSNK